MKRRLQRRKISGFAPGYFDWDPLIEATKTGFYPYTPPVTLFYGLHEVSKMLLEEGMSSVVERHSKLAAACRAAVSAWGLETQCNNETEYSNAVTAVRVPEGINADEVRGAIFDRFNLSLGGGLGKVQEKYFGLDILDTKITYINGCALGC